MGWGVHDYPEPPKVREDEDCYLDGMPVFDRAYCPVCCRRCTTVFRSLERGQIIGCDKCIEELDTADVSEIWRRETL